MNSDTQGYADRLREAALHPVYRKLPVVLYGGKISLEKRGEIKSRIEDEDDGFVVHILDDIHFPEGVMSSERLFARDALANIFLFDPEWQSYGAAHELTTLIEYDRLRTVAIIRPDEGGWEKVYSAQAAREAIELISDLCYEYPVDSWGECSEITHICKREMHRRRKLLEVFPNRVISPPLLP